MRRRLSSALILLAVGSALAFVVLVGALTVCSWARGTGVPYFVAGTASAATPVNVTLPAISGAATQGSTLTASTGSWTNSPSSYAYQWLSAPNQGNTYSPIGGATSSTYVLQSTDVNSYIEVQVTATNGAGNSAPATSPCL